MWINLGSVREHVARTVLRDFPFIWGRTWIMCDDLERKRVCWNFYYYLNEKKNVWGGKDGVKGPYLKSKKNVHNCDRWKRSPWKLKWMLLLRWERTYEMAKTVSKDLIFSWKKNVHSIMVAWKGRLKVKSNVFINMGKNVRGIIVTLHGEKCIKRITYNFFWKKRS